MGRALASFVRLARAVIVAAALAADPSAALADAAPVHDSCRHQRAGVCTWSYEGFETLGLCGGARCNIDVPLDRVAAARAEEIAFEQRRAAAWSLLPPFVALGLAMAGLTLVARRRARAAADAEALSRPAPRPVPRAAKPVTLAVAAALGAGASAVGMERGALPRFPRVPGPVAESVPAELSLSSWPDGPRVLRRAGRDEVLASFDAKKGARRAQVLVAYDLESKAARFVAGVDAEALRHPLRFTSTDEHLVIVDGLGDATREALATATRLAGPRFSFRVRHLRPSPADPKIVWLETSRFVPTYLLDASSGGLTELFARPEWAAYGPPVTCSSAIAYDVTRALGEGSFAYGCVAGPARVAARPAKEGWEIACIDQPSGKATWRATAPLEASQGSNPWPVFFELAGDVLLTSERTASGRALVARRLADGAVAWSAASPYEPARHHPPLVAPRHVVLHASESSSASARTRLEVRSRATGELAFTIP